MENFYRWLSYKLPKKLVYFTVIRAWANSTSGKYGNESPTGISCELVIERLESLK
ncbi:MAG: hypothetical protein WCH62_06340 [Candidatus Omnitrophota bacterium]